MSGFFSSSTLTQKPPVASIPKCGACGAFKLCQSPKMSHRGKGKKRILIVGEYPSQGDDKKDRPFCGEKGRFLEDALFSFGLDLKEDCWMTNAMICLPTSYSDKALANMTDYCAPNLHNLIAELKPVSIILLGLRAVQAFLRTCWKEDVGPLQRWLKWEIPCQKPNAWVYPMQSIVAVLSEKKNSVMKRSFMEQLEKAVSRTETPWEVIPEWSKEVSVLMDSDTAVKAIDVMSEKGGIIAMDYEANSLKPEYPETFIACVSFCANGRSTIATPWNNGIREATKRIIRNKNCKFIAANMKYEDRFTTHFVGASVRNWWLDTMIAAHVLDNRSGICSLKFQAFVNFGMPDYNFHIEPYLNNDGNTHYNRIREIDMNELCLYCGLDSFLEYKLAVKQAKQLNLQNI